MSNTHYKKWRDSLTLFLDDGFDNDESFDLLVSAGFSVQRFGDHFKNPDGTRLRGVKDPEVIRLCNRHGWILLSLDKEIISLHRRDIEQAVSIGILATAHNSDTDGPLPWVRAFLKLKDTIEKNNFKKRQRPWFGKFNRLGSFSVVPFTVLPRPKEMESAGEKVETSDVGAVSASRAPVS